VAGYEKAGLAMEGVAELRVKLAAQQKHHEETKQKLDATQQELDATQQEQVAIKQELVATKQKLEATKQKLEATIQELEATKQKLDATQQELVATKQKLEATIQELEATKQKLDATQQELEATKQKLDATQQELDAIKQELVATKQKLEATIQKLEATIQGQTADFRSQLAQQEMHHNSQLEAIKQKLDATQQELEATIQEQTADFRSQLAQQEMRHNSQLEANKQEKETIKQALEKKNRAIQQRQRNTFVAGQLATVFIERLGMKFLKGDWKKHRSRVANLDSLREAMGDATALDKYLAENAGGVVEDDIRNALFDAKDNRNPSAHPVCLEPDHTDGECECDPTPDEVLAAIHKVTPDRDAKIIMSWVASMTDSLKRELQHRRLLQAS
jgi:chromosome segregation ATPase